MHAGDMIVNAAEPRLFIDSDPVVDAVGKVFDAPGAGAKFNKM
jgi:hypothetical protein